MRAKIKEIIIPSAPFKNYGELEQLAMRVDSLIKRMQIDVCDGKYVGSISWPFTEFSKTDFEKLGYKADVDVFLPLWEDIDYSVDLMVEHPEKYIDSFVAYGIDQVFIHFRSVLKDSWKEIFEKCEQYSLGLILATDAATDMDAFKRFVEDNIGKLSGIQVMGIEKIGFQGQELSTKSLDIVRNLKHTFPGTTIYFDGGINEDTIQEIKNAGVDVFCVGSYLTQADFIEENLEILSNILSG